MNDDLDFQESLDRYFEIEAAELLQTIEETLMLLVEEKNIERVHTLMRSAHTIKGSAANFGYKTIETIAHHLEDVFQALYPPELEIDPELGLLLLEGYECLYQPLSATLAGLTYDEAATLERTAELFARLQTHLGDFFGRETPLPTAAELGFDVVGSIFTDSIPQDLEVLSDAIATQNIGKVQESIISLAEFLLELGGSYSLPGIATIASTTLTALERHPQEILAIAQIALKNFEAAQIAIIGGDRSIGGQVSAELNAWIESAPNTCSSEPKSNDSLNNTNLDDSANWLSLMNANSEPVVTVNEDIDKQSSSDDSANWLSLVTEDYAEPVVTANEDIDKQSSSDDSANWLSLVTEDYAEPVVTANEDIDKQSSSDDSANWLSLVTDDYAEPVVTANEDIDKQSPSDDSANWLSLVTDNYAEPVVTANEDIDKQSPSDDSANWLSLVTDNYTEPVVTANEDIDKQSPSDDSANWLSLVTDNYTEPVVTANEDIDKQSPSDDSANWLSLVTDNHAESVVDLDNNSAEEQNFDEIEIEEFEPDSIGLTSSSSLTHTKYSIDKTQTNSSSELIISKLSGIDRIFQSIALDSPQIAPVEEDLKSPTTPSTQDSQVSVRVATIQLERLSHTIGELLIDDNQQYLRAEQLEELAQSTIEQYRRCEHRLRLVSDWADKYNSIGQNTHALSRKSAKKPKQKTKTTEVQSQFDSLELDVYSDLSILLQNLTDEIAECGVRVETLVENTKKSRFTLSKRKQLLADAQTELFAARMVEVSTVLNRFPRLLQQMVASHRKPAQLELIGTTVSIDKIIAEKLYDPLLHLIRNAYDHGVEAPETRRQQGKPEVGQLTIKVYHQGNRTAIEVSDDGQGLNWVKIRQRAIDLNLLPAHRADSATESELSEIMFAPGFSTAEKVNDLSGRGIGLDVVRDRLGALQGSIDVRSISGKGTTFVMQFPLNLTTARLLICESAGVVHALRSEAIAQVLLPTPDRIQSQSLHNEKGAARFLRWGEGSSQKLIPIYPLNDLLEYHCPLVASVKEDENLFPIKASDRVKSLLLLEMDERQICIEVDRILVEQELVVKSLGQTFGLPSYIQGYSVLGDGGLTLSLDPVELITQTRIGSTSTFQSSKLALAPALQAALAPASDDTIEAEIVDTPANNTPTIGKSLQVLVVDDSLVQRQTLARSLTKAGCQVILASHGREGLIKLQEHPRISLVVCDIEMPQMNGFEFLSHCRQDPRLTHLPIIMLTTRGGQKHRQLAMTLGAKDYLTKPQSERELLDIIAKLSADPVGV